MPDAFPTAVYLLCFATSSACAILLARNYLRTGATLLMWSAGCFTLLAANNFAVIVDLLLLPGNNLRVVRLGFSLAAVMVLLFGFIWSAKD